MLQKIKAYLGNPLRYLEQKSEPKFIKVSQALCTAPHKVRFFFFSFFFFFFQDKIFFIFCHENIYYEYSLEAPR